MKIFPILSHSGCSEIQNLRALFHIFPQSRVVFDQHFPCGLLGGEVGAELDNRIHHSLRLIKGILPHTKRAWAVTAYTAISPYFG